jgi:hypothetical protein
MKPTLEGDKIFPRTRKLIRDDPWRFALAVAFSLMWTWAFIQWTTGKVVEIQIIKTCQN